MSAHTLEYDRGVHLQGSILWFDARRHDVLSFVSSARMDGAWRHSQALCSDNTRAFLRVSRPSFSALVCTPGRSISLGLYTLSMYSAGFMPGSTQLLVESEQGRLLYACNLLLEPHALAEPLQHIQADILVLKAAYGASRYRFPPREMLHKKIAQRAKELLETGYTPVFLCSPAGKAQEAVYALTDAQLNVCAHPWIARMNHAYRKAGFDPGPAAICGTNIRPGQCVVFPEKLRSSVILRRIQKPHFIWLSGRSLQPDVRIEPYMDEGIPLASHLDHPGLLEYVKKSGAQKVYVTGVWAISFAKELRSMGYDAIALHQETQLSLF